MPQDRPAKETPKPPRFPSVALVELIGKRVVVHGSGKIGATIIKGVLARIDAFLLRIESPEIIGRNAVAKPQFVLVNLAHCAHVHPEGPVEPRGADQTSDNV